MEWSDILCEVQSGKSRLVLMRDYALMAVTILVGIVLLPIMILLYLIPSVREAFDQLAYEDAMRG